MTEKKALYTARTAPLAVKSSSCSVGSGRATIAVSATMKEGAVNKGVTMCTWCGDSYEVESIWQLEHRCFNAEDINSKERGDGDETE